MFGRNDWNPTILNAEQIYSGMKRVARGTQLILSTDEDNRLKRPSFLKDRTERYLDWLKKISK
jgi:dipeptidyl aminopeptidase/acylaminoacyl peptidase